MLNMQGHRKLLKGGLAIGTNVRSYAAVDLLEVVKQLRNWAIYGKYFILSDQEGLW